MGKTKIKFKMDKNFKNMDKWVRSVGQTEGLKSSIMRSASYQLGNRIAYNCPPSRTGKLQQSFTPGTPYNYCKITIGKTSILVLGTTVEYAEAVEYGYDQRNRVNKTSGKKPSLWVPGYWSSGTFHYVEGAKEKGFKGGMLLTGRIVEGAHMVDTGSRQFIELDLPDIIKNEILSWYNSLQ